MSQNIFILNGVQTLTRLARQAYESEDWLQRIIAEHPDLVGSALGVDGGLLLVSREQGVPDGAGSSDRWSLDHLFLDRNGVPILVEVKRATDTRARREVVAQMLDYAANGVTYWPVDAIINSFENATSATGADPTVRLSTFLGSSETDFFWPSVDANLRSGRIRMVFLADVIGKELKRIIEFLNEQMRPAEVLGVELVQFVSETGLRTLVPSLVGATERAQTVKAIRAEKPPLDETDWLTALGETRGADAMAGAHRAIEWLRGQGLETAVTKAQDSISAMIVSDEETRYPFFIRRTGNFEVALQYLQYHPAFQSEASRLHLLTRMQALPGVTIKTTKTTGWPAVPLQNLLQNDLWDALVPVLSDVVSAMRDKAR